MPWRILLLHSTKCLSSEGEWTNYYDICGLSLGTYRVGRLMVSRKNISESAYLLKIELVKHKKKRVEQIVLKSNAELYYSKDNFLFPKKWKCSTGIYDGENLSELPIVSASGTVSHGIYRIKTGNIKREYRSDSLIIPDWSLFDICQRITEKTYSLIKFDMIANFDQFKSLQKLSYRGRYEIDYKGTILNLHAYQKLGSGSVPVVYWLNQSNRLLFVSSGIEGYIWNERMAIND